MIRVDLTNPITVIDQKITAIEFRDAVGEDLIGLPDMQADKAGWTIALADRLAANVPPGTVRKLPALEAMRVSGRAAEAIRPTKPASSSTATSSALAGGETVTS